MEPAEKHGVAEARAPEADPFETWSVWVKDNVEAFVVAFIIALIVRCFCIEVFKIPTGSMTPTLLGDHEVVASGPRGAGRAMVGGDRIMVSKFMYRLFPIERFDVVVFKFPLDTSRNFIKRLVGLPNERLCVWQGDLYACPRGEKEYQIARKPLRVQESIWIPVYPSAAQARLAGAWKAEPPEAARVSDDAAEMDSSKAAGGQPVLAYGPSITDNYEVVGYRGGQSVGDLRLAATVTWLGGVPAGRAGGVTLRIRCQPDWVEAWLPATGQGRLQWETDGGQKKQASFDSPLGDGHPHDVALLSYDGLAHLRIDGASVAEFAYRDGRQDSRKGESGASFIVADGMARLEHVTLGRDIYYLDGGTGSVVHPEGTPIEIPDRCYIMMGDNSPNSKDSRLWTLKVFRLRDGREIRADGAQPFRYGDDRVDVRDVYGVQYHLKRSDLLSPTPESAPREEAVFVKEELIVGKAFYVWWPLNRMKLIR